MVEKNGVLIGTLVVSKQFSNPNNVHRLKLLKGFSSIFVLFCNRNNSIFSGCVCAAVLLMMLLFYWLCVCVAFIFFLLFSDLITLPSSCVCIFVSKANCYKLFTITVKLKHLPSSRYMNCMQQNITKYHPICWASYALANIGFSHTVFNLQFFNVLPIPTPMCMCER